MKVVVLFFLWAGSCFGVTKEVVQVFVPASYHDTDSATEYGVKGELLQAAVIDRFMVLSGAFPEDLAKAVLLPLQFTSNNPTYEVKEANLAILCGLELDVTQVEETLNITINCSELEIPEVVEITAHQVLAMTIESLRRTLRLYYAVGAHESLTCSIHLSELGDEHQKLTSLKTTFEVGESE